VAEEGRSHETTTSVIETFPPEVEARAEAALQAEVSCPDSCDLRHGILRIVLQDGGVVKEVELAQFDGRVNLTDQVSVKAPYRPGVHTWRAVFPAQGKEGHFHEESSTSFSFMVKPHSTSMAVWAVPSPLAVNSKFRVKVGVKCAAECNLAGKEVRVYGERGAKVATGFLGRVPLPGTSALYWTELELEAPGIEGYYSWRVRFLKPDLVLPHEGASCKFGFTTAPRPEHLVTVEVTDKNTNSSVKKANLLLRPQSGYPYRACSDAAGVGRLEVPRGEYTLIISKGSDYGVFKATFEVNGDVNLKAELAPGYDPFA
jgi:hypothetical protein